MMIRQVAIAVASLLASTSVWADPSGAPPLRVLENIAGASADSTELTRFLKTYGFSENPKRKQSWGSPHGVMVELNANGTAIVGIRPPSEFTNMPTYSGHLPSGLQAGDSIAEVERKLGQPQRVDEPGPGIKILRYRALTVHIMDTKLFEVWLAGDKKGSVPPRVPESR